MLSSVAIDSKYKRFITEFNRFYDNFAHIEEQGVIPLSKCDKVTDDIYEVSNFRTDYQLIAKSQIKKQKKSKGRE